MLSSRPVRAGRDDVVIEVASAGADHDAAVFMAPIAGIGVKKAKAANTDKPTVAEVLARISELIGKKAAA